MENTETENKKGILQNDRLLVCSMLIFYGFCILGLVGAAFWWLNQRSQALSANATSTAAVAATQQASISARTTEQAQYKFIDPFDSNNHWFAGPQNNDYWKGTIAVKDGVYSWKVNEVKKTFVWWADFYHGFPLQDFDVYLDTKFVAGPSGDVCGGLVFRKSSDGWDDGAYIFTICNDSTYKIEYHGENGWEDISGWKYNDVIRRSDWNRIEINAQGDNFIFTINNEAVYELTDERLEEGGLAIIVDIQDENAGEIWFDNFAYQTP